mmetsp:Transcript_84235/g.235027  ORF Transcript_84235/g.235027 Transcript_84235/m.235027 type:complete len:570 (-) Transcript_84235:138-1847(-)
MALDAKLAKVVQRCLADVARHPVRLVDVYLGDDLAVWHLALNYPEEAPFLGGPGGSSLRAANFTLYATLRFGADFPQRPPKLKFESKWINHQHLWGDRICHSLLSDDFFDYFMERRTHGTSMWNAGCALADADGVGGMPRYLQLLREFLSSDLDYDEEQHVRYDAESLQRDVEAQRLFRPEFLDTAHRLEPLEAGSTAASPPATALTSGDIRAEADDTVASAWANDFFSKEPLVPGSRATHPCFDVAVISGRLPILSTTMTTLCLKSFEEGARTTDFGSPITAVLPFPCSCSAWAQAGVALFSAALADLSPVAAMYALRLPSSSSPEAQKLEVILGVVGEIWRATCISIVKDEGYESERAMMCFVTLHFLLLCLAEEHAGLREYAATTVREFVQQVETTPLQNLKERVPDLGRFLVRFLLTAGDESLDVRAPVIVRELFRRNVRWVDMDYWPYPEADEAKKQGHVLANFDRSQFGMKLMVFQSYYVLRSRELGLDALPALEACQGRPSPEAMRLFQQDCREIKQMESFQEFFLWLQLDSMASEDIHELLCKAVEESEACGYNAGLPPRP